MRAISPNLLAVEPTIEAVAAGLLLAQSPVTEWAQRAAGAPTGTRPVTGGTGRSQEYPEFDVVLDIPNLCVNRIFLKVDSVTAKLNLNARVANPVRIDAGADVLIGNVALTIQGVRAQALLLVQLDDQLQSSAGLYAAACQHTGGPQPPDGFPPDGRPINGPGCGTFTGQAQNTLDASLRNGAFTSKNVVRGGPCHLTRRRRGGKSRSRASPCPGPGAGRRKGPAGRCTRRPTGAARLPTLLYAVVPQVKPVFAGVCIYRWDINIRESTILGLVGAGGIGHYQHLPGWATVPIAEVIAAAGWSEAALAGACECSKIHRCCLRWREVVALGDVDHRGDLARTLLADGMAQDQFNLRCYRRGLHVGLHRCAAIYLYRDRKSALCRVLILAILGTCHWGVLAPPVCIRPST